MTDWNKILKRNKEYIKTKDKIKSKIEDRRLSQMGMEESLSTLFKPLLKQENVPAIENVVPPAIENEFIIIKSLDDIRRYFSNPDPTLPKSIKPVVDNRGLLLNGYRILFDHTSPKFKVDTKNFIYNLTEGLIDLINGGDIATASNTDLIDYYTFLLDIKKGGAKTNRMKEVKLHIDAMRNASPITEEIDEFNNMTYGEGVTFLSDDPEQLLKRLNVIIEAMKHGHQSDSNEVNAILKRLLEKGIISKEDYINVIKNG